MPVTLLPTLPPALARAKPRPSSRPPLVSTPTRVDFPLSTFPITWAAGSQGGREGWSAWPGLGVWGLEWFVPVHVKSVPQIISNPKVLFCMEGASHADVAPFFDLPEELDLSQPALEPRSPRNGHCDVLHVVLHPVVRQLFDPQVLGKAGANHQPPQTR